MTRAEQQIIRKAAAGDRMAFRELVLEHSHAMFRLAWRLCGDENAADDIVQEAFIKAWRKIGDFRMQSGFRSWLHRITVNTAMDYLRKQARVKQHETAAPELECLAAGSSHPKHDVQIDVQEQTRAAMMNLSDTERAALMLRHFEGHSIKEIAQILDLSSSACKQAVFRAVKKMRIELAPLVTT
ncbi:MAG: RNA polymerase sigma factor [Xanthomonadales bacterium]|jgi:RNA polymerase sigma-70 factor (ECF subfamily)|nr:RNA polymerase sigma factor [Xanthomonadales bacterium]MDH3923643.1 RNA polymerase sigma factor [Xanthomonadales bacterium]MDH3941682.1 RNA polymerase sigma factor [Xanthomonadales bacterium]MDH4001301.1 RNA polymerase sigma factor [Xanthomonadales bacterium]